MLVHYTVVQCALVYIRYITVHHCSLCLLVYVNVCLCISMHLSAYPSSGVGRVGIRVSAIWNLNPGSRILDPGKSSSIQDPGSLIKDPGSGMQDPASRTLDPGPWMHHPGPKIHALARPVSLNIATRFSDSGAWEDTPNSNSNRTSSCAWP